MAGIGLGTFFTFKHKRRDKLCLCPNMYKAFTYLLNNIYIRLCTKLSIQIVGVPIDTNCASLGADLFLFCCGGDFMASLSNDKQTEIIQAFK